MHNFKKVFILLVILGLILPAAAKKQIVAAKEIKSLEIPDILAWNGLSRMKVSHDGKWFAYQAKPNRGDSKLFIRQTNGEKEYSFALGEVSRVKVEFSHDSRWLAFNIHPQRAEAKKLKKQREKLYKKVKLVNLATGKEIEFKKVQDFTFPGENSHWIAMHKYAPKGITKEKESWSGKDLILYHLNSQSQYNVGNVSEFAFDKKGFLLAYIIDAQDKVGNGVHIRNLATLSDRCLDSGEYSYKALTWTPHGTGLCLLRGKKSKEYKEMLYSVIGFKNIQDKKAQKYLYEPLMDNNFPRRMTISTKRPPRWTKDLEAFVFGIHKVEEKEEKNKEKKEEKEIKEPQNGKTLNDQNKVGKKQTEKEEKPGLVLWHWKDKRLQSQQQVDETKDKKFNYLSIYWVKNKKFLRLADESLKDVEFSFNDHIAVGIDDEKHMLQYNLDGIPSKDIYTVDKKTGKKKLLLKRCKWDFDISPNGEYFLYFGEGHFHVLNLLTGKTTNITANLPTSFLDEENDENIEDLPNEPVGWTRDSRYVILYDNWDVWKVQVPTGNAVNLTLNGKKKAIHYEKRFDIYKDFEEEEGGIDLKRPQYFRMYGEWTKKGGIARLDRGKSGGRVLLWGDYHYRALLKARNADVFLYRQETVKDYPNFYVAGSGLQKGKRITDLNPQQKDYPWCSGSRLIDYTGKNGEKLQAALYLPAGYSEGKAYPTIVYIYEELSQRLNNYPSPRAIGFNAGAYTSRGYAVLMPDIVYKIDDPGMSAVWCVLPALKAAIATGIVNKDKVGLQGHSWGGYQTAFLVTQTDMFAAAIAGAPLTNMISMYSSIYWNVGISNQQLFESGQGRFSVGYWENPEAYIRNSPVFHARKVNTPLMILHNDKDGAVDWNQGIEYYNTLRRLKKPVIMLQYKGENHGVRKSENRIDYTRRSRAFFDHYLLGKPAPKWMTSGVPHLELGNHLEEIEKKASK